MLLLDCPLEFLREPRDSKDAIENLDIFVHLHLPLFMSLYDLILEFEFFK